MGGNRSLLLLLIRISTGVCVKWTGEFLKPSYKGELQIVEQNGEDHFILRFSSNKMVAELDHFSKEPTLNSYSLLLSSNPCGDAWAEAVLGYIQANQTVAGVENLAEAQSVRLLHCSEEPCLLLVTELDCAPLANDTFVLSIEIVIVLIVAGLIFVIIVICIPIIYCCIKSRSKRERKVKLGEEEEGERDSIDDPFLMDLDNRHTKSELSIPYMDASLPPTPKGGRSGFRLADLLGNNNKGSETSLTEKPM